MRKLMVVLAVTLLIGALVTGLLWQRVQDERVANGALQARVTALEAMLPAAATPDAPTAAPAAVEAFAQTEAAAAPASANAAEQVQALTAGIRQMMASPEGRELTRAQARMTMSMQYPHLGAELGMSPAEVDKFYDLLARQQADLTVFTMDATTDAGTDNAGTQEMQRKLAEQRRANDAELVAALGDKAAQWRTYQQSLPLRQQVAQLQLRLGGDNDALSDAQARPLVATLAAEKARIDGEQRNAPRLPQGSTREQYMAQQQQRRTDSNRRLLEAAAAHLTPQQLASYKRMMDQELEMERAIMGSLEAQPGAIVQGAQATAPH